MNEPRPFLSSDARTGAAGDLEVMEQGIDQRSGPVSRCRMHDDARRFVEDQQVLVFKKYFQRNRLALQLEWLRLRDIHRDLIGRLDLLAGPVRPAHGPT